MVHKLVQLLDSQISQFREQGFLILEEFLETDLVNGIIDRLDPLFALQFETGIWPDELHGRVDVSHPNAIKQISGMWRCDRKIASVSLSSEIARLNAILAGWTGARLATDVGWIKPPNAPEIAFHRNSTYASCIDPLSVITCWIALSNATSEASTLEFVPGSHQWDCSDKPRFLHAPKEDYRSFLWKAAAEAGVKNPEIVKAIIPAGGCIFLHGNLWHGSGRNMTLDQTHRSCEVSSFPMHAKFQPPGVGYGYIFSGYKAIDSLDMDESFFPILWTSDGYRTPMLTAYCEDALVPSLELTKAI